MKVATDRCRAYRCFDFVADHDKEGWWCDKHLLDLAERKAQREVLQWVKDVAPHIVELLETGDGYAVH